MAESNNNDNKTTVNMDKFLEVISVDYFNRHDDVYDNMPQPTAFTAKLESILSRDMCDDLTEMLADYIIELREYCAAQGMKAAIDIINGKYWVLGSR